MDANDSSRGSLSQSLNRKGRHRGSIDDDDTPNPDDEILIDPSIIRPPRTGEEWRIVVTCKGADGEFQRIVQGTVDKADISYVTLASIKDQLGYNMRDYLYYMKRHGIDVASIEAIEFRRDADNILETMGSERKLRFIVTKKQETERNVNITPLKNQRTYAFDAGDDEEEEDDDDSLDMGESLDAYKDWLLEKGPETDLHDVTREETVTTYTEWLKEQGHLNDILYYKREAERRPQPDESNGTTASEDIQWPPHARKIKKMTAAGKKGGRGSMKALVAMAKRLKVLRATRSVKLKIEFSENYGGPCGDNRRIFVDEIVWVTRLHAPLIGVKYWKHIDVEVKKLIADSILEGWEMEDNDASRELIWKIAKERYKGWRSAFSATYRAHGSYDARMRHKPDELDFVEWHYLCEYFGTKKFKKISSQNSTNRHQMKTMHVMGSKPFSQCSWEMRNIETGAEPGPVELFKISHTKKGGKWSNEMSKTIYLNASRKLCMTNSEEVGDEGSPSITCGIAKENIVFQATRKEVTGAKSTKSVGHGYLSKPNKNHLLQGRIEEQDHEIQQLKEQLAKRDAEKEEERKQLEASITQSVMQNVQALFAQNRNGAPANEPTFQTNNTTQDEPINNTTQDEHVSPLINNNTTLDEGGSNELNNTTECLAARIEANNDETPMLREETLKQMEPRSVVTIEKRNIPPTSNPRPSKISKNLFNENAGNGGATPTYISSQQLLSGANTRARKKKQQVDIQAPRAI